MVTEVMRHVTEENQGTKRRARRQIEEAPTEEPPGTRGQDAVEVGDTGKGVDLGWTGDSTLSRV